MPVPLTSPVLSARRWPLGRVAAVFALAGSVCTVSAATVSAATASAATASAATASAATDQISAVNVPKSVAENGIVGGDSMTVTIFFHTPTPAATTVTLKNFDTAVASFPAKIVVPEGDKKATFTVTTSPVSTPTLDQIIANDSPTSATEDGVEFTVEP